MPRLITDIYPIKKIPKQYFTRGLIILVIGSGLLLGNWLGVVRLPSKVQEAEAAVTAANLTSGSSTTDASSYTTASITPSANKLILVAVTIRNDTSDAASAPTISGNGLTWVQINTQSFGARQNLTLFRSMGASPSAGVITIDTGGDTMDMVSWTVAEFDGVDTSGTNGSGAIVQNAVNSTTGATSLTVTLAAFGSANNATYGTFTHSQFNEGIAQGTGFTELADSFAAGVYGTESEWRNDNDTSVDASWVTSTRGAGIAVEIKASAGAAAPTVTSVTGQNPQTTAGGKSITINGTNFVATPTVTVGGTSATNVTFVSSTQLTATAPAKAAGSYNVVVTNPDSQSGTCTNCMTYTAPPTVTNVDPNSGLNTAGGETVTITGTGIKVGSSGVKIDTTYATTSGSSSSATFTTPAHADGSVTLRVYGTSGTDANGIYYDYSPFTYTAQAQVTAANLTSGSSTTDASSYTTASITPSANQLILVAVTIRNDTSAAAPTPTISGNGLTWVAIDNQTMGARQKLTLFRSMGASPSAGVITIDTGGDTQDMASWTVDQFDGVDTSGTNGSGAIVQSAKNSATGATSLTVALVAFGSANNATYGTFAHVVSNEAITQGTGFTELADSFAAAVYGTESEWRNDNDTSVDASWVTSGNAAGIAVEIKAAAGAAPTVTDVNPNNGLNTAGGETVTITGTGIKVGSNGVKVDTTYATTSGSSTSATFTTPAHSAGAVTLRVYGTSGTDSNGIYYDYSPFTYGAAPTVTSVTGQNPQTTAGGKSITINGTNFVATPTVTVGGTSATNVTFVSSIELTATAPAKAAGSYDVVVTNPDTQSGTCTTCMTYTAPPTVTNVNPNDGLNTAGGETVTITGTSLKVGSNGVKVDTTYATTSGTSTSVTFTTPAHAAGSVTLRVYGTGGNDVNGIYYDYSPFTYTSQGGVTAANLTSGSSTTDASSYTTASITPSANQLILVAVTIRNDISALAPIPTISGNSLTWVQIDSQTLFGQRERITLFRSMGASPSAGVITIDTGGDTQDMASWTVDQFDGVDTSGTNGSGAIVQSAKNNLTGVTALTVTLASFSSTNNATYGVFTHAVTNEDIESGIDFTELADSFAAAIYGTESEFRSDSSTSVDASWATEERTGGIALEIKSSLAESAASGSLISSTFDTGFSGGVKLNSILWQGSLGTGGTNNVKFQMASSHCSNGATDSPTCTTSVGWGGAKTSGDGAFIGSDGTSTTYYGPVSPNTPSVIPTNQHNNKRYFRYKIFLDKAVDTTTPVVKDVIINYSP